MKIDVRKKIARFEDGQTVGLRYMLRYAPLRSNLHSASQIGKHLNEPIMNTLSSRSIVDALPPLRWDREKRKDCWSHKDHLYADRLMDSPSRWTRNIVEDVAGPRAIADAISRIRSVVGAEIDD